MGLSHTTFEAIQAFAKPQHYAIVKHKLENYNHGVPRRYEIAYPHGSRNTVYPWGFTIVAQGRLLYSRHLDFATCPWPGNSLEKRFGHCGDSTLSNLQAGDKTNIGWTRDRG